MTVSDYHSPEIDLMSDLGVFVNNVRGIFSCLSVTLTSKAVCDVSCFKECTYSRFLCLKHYFVSILKWTIYSILSVNLNLRHNVKKIVSRKTLFNVGAMVTF